MIRTFLIPSRAPGEYLADSLRVIGVLSVVAAAIWWTPTDAGILAFTLPGLMVPRFVRVRPAFDVVFSATLLIAAWSNVIDLYRTVPGWDNIVHFVCTGVLVPLLYLFLARLSVVPAPGDPAFLRRIAVVHTVSLGLAISALWEMVEWFGWVFITPEIYITYEDTIGDMAMGGFGALCAGVVMAAVPSAFERLESAEQMQCQRRPAVIGTVLVAAGITVGVVVALSATLGMPAVPAMWAVLAAVPVPAALAWLWIRLDSSPITWADRFTLVRISIAGVLSGVGVLVLAGALPDRTLLVVVFASVGLLSDAVDGWIARSSRTTSAAGARMDMEADAALLAVLCVLAAPTVGWWVLAIGAMRYVFAVVGRFRPRLRDAAPPNAWRRPIAAAQGIAVLIALVPAVPVWAAVACCASALVLLAFSFVSDVVALERSA